MLAGFESGGISTGVSGTDDCERGRPLQLRLNHLHGLKSVCLVTFGKDGRFHLEILIAPKRARSLHISSSGETSAQQHLVLSFLPLCILWIVDLLAWGRGHGSSSRRFFRIWIFNWEDLRIGMYLMLQIHLALCYL